MFLDSSKIRALLYKKRKTQTDLAKEIPVSRSVISHICNEKSCARKTAEKVAVSLGENLENLIKE